MLSRHFSHMAREIDGLIQTDYTNRILLREAQLRRVEEKLTQAIEEADAGRCLWRS